METPRTLFQHCDKCNTETNFKYETVTCNVCGTKQRSYIEKSKKEKS